MKTPTVTVEVDWRRWLEGDEPPETLVGEAMAEAVRRASLIAAASNLALGDLDGWELSHLGAWERRPYPLGDVPLRLDGFSGSGAEKSGDGGAATGREGRVVVRGVWKMTGTADPA